MIENLDNRVKHQQQELQEKSNNSEKILFSLKSAIMTRTFSVNYMMCKRKVTPEYECLQYTPVEIPTSRGYTTVSRSYSTSTSDWNSPAMYAYPGGYKFRIDIDDKTSGVSGLQVKLKGLSGEYDDQLQWPARVSFIVELVNWKGGDNWKVSKLIEWKAREEHVLAYAGGVFIENSKLDSYLHNDRLHFKVISMIM